MRVCVHVHAPLCVYVCMSGSLGTANLQVIRSLGRTPGDSRTLVHVPWKSTSDPAVRRFAGRQGLGSLLCPGSPQTDMDPQPQGQGPNPPPPAPTYLPTLAENGKFIL